MQKLIMGSCFVSGFGEFRFIEGLVNRVTLYIAI